MLYYTGGVSDIGNIRKINQDSILIKHRKYQDKNYLLCAVADGMGGLSDGELASRCIIKELENWWEDTFQNLLCTQINLSDINSMLEFIIENANRKMNNIAKQKNEKLGTTLSVVFLYQDSYCYKHIGDSRIYQIRKRQIKQVTKDQTWCQQEVDKGNMSYHTMKTHKNRHILSNALGVQENFFVEEGKGILKKGELLLICSDGYYSYFEQLKILEQYLKISFFQKLLNRIDLQKKIEESIKQIKTYRAEDNLSAVVIWRRK